MENFDEKKNRETIEKYELIHKVIVFLRIVCIAAIIIPLMVVGGSDEVTSDSTSNAILIVIIVSVIGLIILGFWGMDVSETINECQSNALKAELRQMNDRGKLLDDALAILGIKDRMHFDKEHICFGNSNLYILNSNDMGVVESFSQNMEDSVLKSIANDRLKSHSIEIKDIVFFSKEGDVQYTTSISGGGGGGSSIKGAIVGGMIAGDAGAIIGSRKKVEEIKTVENKHDSRETVLRYKKDDKILEKRYDGFGVYKFLFKHIPEKDLLNIQLSQNVSNNVNAEKPDDTEEKLIKLKGLYDKNLIDKEEYEMKRKEIIDSI